MKIKISTTIRYCQKNASISQLKNNPKNSFPSAIIFGETKVTKEMLYAAKKAQENLECLC